MLIPPSILPDVALLVAGSSSKVVSIENSVTEVMFSLVLTCKYIQQFVVK